MTDAHSGAAAQLDAVLAALEGGRAAALERLFELLRIPSVSTEAAHQADCARAADWLAGALAELGFEARAVPSPAHQAGGHPMVLAHDPNPPANALRVLFYGHYDVQPVDPIALWDHPPFEPKVETGADRVARIRARGAADDKGQVMTFLEALRAWKTVSGGFPVNVTVLLEGEEEAGGLSMEPFLEAHRDALKADIALICDTGLWNAETPSIAVSLRGLLGEEVIVRAADRDLHSGHFGSAARNPIQLLASILADLRAPDGSVTLPGFYDGVPETPASVRKSWDALGFSADAFLGDVGLSVPAGEADRSPLEQLWARPTAEINGIWGGYTGDGFKTVIPAEASAKLSFRLVGEQDPDAIRAAFRAHVTERLPADCTAEFKGHGASKGVTVDVERPEMKAAAAALAAEWGVAPALVGMGGSIPVVGQFKRQLGLESLLVGFGLEEDRIHSPNETYRLSSFEKGARSWARILAALAE